FTIHSDSQIIKTSYTVSDIINTVKKNKILLISSYREPISQYLSCYFQNIEQRLNMSLDEIINMDFNLLLQKIINDMHDTKWLVHPFLENDKKNFDNVNIYDTPFNKVKGFQTFETDKIKILLLRFDKISTWEEIIRMYTQYKN